MPKATKKKQVSVVNYFTRNILTVIGLVLIWRGIWYILDAFDIFFFQDHRAEIALGGLIIGLLILYLPDKDLKEIEKL